MFSEFVARWRTRFSQVLGIVFVVVFLVSDKKFEAVSPFFTEVLFIAGCVLVGLATVGRLWCAQYIAGYKTDVLVTEGPYSICRNPLYFFSFLGAVGVGLCTECLTLTLVILLVFAAIYPTTIRNEERVLLRHFGEAYAGYTADVPRFFPDIKLFHEPAEYVVKPKIFRREVFDALYFVWIVGVFECMETLIELHVIPTFLSIY